ncbi:5-methyltetrahydrofolate--homocysteine methyltransferase [Acetobacterium malicum]|uniref:5-methyltetrahydrofolate--homocysteine methyltransferase n=1 Tax=Acetobacterium malicum TaxID=52692 RepID=UPI00041A4F23|nr:5-methyltetrahydrofolate--homocysteine methyltransferase [Acetobacterium dehalogenans]
MVYEIPLRFDKNTVFKRMHISKDSNHYDEFERVYEQLEQEIPSYSIAKGSFVLKKATDRGRIHKGLSEVSHLVYVVITLGAEISCFSTSYFEQKNFLKGMMIDQIADQLLFNASDDFYHIIREEIYIKRKFSLTERYCPDDYVIPIQNQATILKVITDNELNIGIGLTEGYVYKPLKTMGYVYGADKNIAIAEKDHDCEFCSNFKCEFRKIILTSKV